MRKSWSKSVTHYICPSSQPPSSLPPLLVSKISARKKKARETGVEVVFIHQILTNVYFGIRERDECGERSEEERARERNVPPVLEETEKMDVSVTRKRGRVVKEAKRIEEMERPTKKKKTQKPSLPPALSPSFFSPSSLSRTFPFLQSNENLLSSLQQSESAAVTLIFDDGSTLLRPSPEKTRNSAKKIMAIALLAFREVCLYEAFVLTMDGEDVMRHVFAEYFEVNRLDGEMKERREERDEMEEMEVVEKGKGRSGYRVCFDCKVIFHFYLSSKLSLSSPVSLSLSLYSFQRFK